MVICFYSKSNKFSKQHGSSVWQRVAACGFNHEKGTFTNNSRASTQDLMVPYHPFKATFQAPYHNVRYIFGDPPGVVFVGLGRVFNIPSKCKLTFSRPTLKKIIYILGMSPPLKTVVMVPLFVAIPILICDTSDRYIYMQNWTLFLSDS